MQLVQQVYGVLLAGMTLCPACHFRGTLIIHQPPGEKYHHAIYLLPNDSSDWWSHFQDDLLICITCVWQTP